MTKHSRHYISPPDTTCCFCARKGKVRRYGDVTVVLCAVDSFDVDMRSATPGEIEAEVSTRIEVIQQAGA